MNIRRLSILLIIVIFYLSSSLPVKVFAEKLVEVDKEAVQIVHQEVKEQMVTNEPIELYGPFAEAHFYYELYSDVTAKDQFLQLVIAKSELLIDPSSITIKVDDEPVYSTELSGEVSNIKVPLEGTALMEGSHTITVTFDGFVKEGVCVPQYTTGNWMSILPNSFLHIERLSNTSDDDIVLHDYPRLYIGSLENHVSVIIPESPTMETMQSAFIIANFLSNQSIENTVQVVQEQEIERILGNSIIVGGTEEFNTAWIKELLQAEIPNVEEESIYLSQVQLKQDDQLVRALVVLAENPKTILNNTDLLTDSQYYEQFSSDVIQVSELPASIAQDSNEQEITFSEIGMPNIELNSLYKQSETYYYSLPTGSIQNPKLELNFKRSATITPYEANQEEELKSKIELIVNINEVPHSVDVRSMQEDADGNVKAIINVKEETLMNRPLMTLQIETSGLRMDQSCIALDQNRWLYLFNDSKLILPTSMAVEKSEMHFNHFPYPFANHEEELTIVLPEERIASRELLSLLSVLTTNNKLPTFTLTQTSELTKEEIKGGNIIFIGSLDEHEQLQSMKDELIVDYKEGVPQLNEQGFLQSEVRFYGFMQQNPWDNSYNLLVLDNLDETNQYFSSDFLSYLQFSDLPASIAVQTGPDRFFTNTLQIEQTEIDKEENQNETSDKSTFIIWGIGFFVLMLIMFLFIIYFIKKRKKLYPNKESKE